jgi:hypothetical protein
MENYYKGKNVEEELNTGNIPIGCLTEKYGWLLVGNFKYPTISIRFMNVLYSSDIVPVLGIQKFGSVLKACILLT